jgi:hypothetical protein
LGALQKEFWLCFKDADVSEQHIDVSCEGSFKYMLDADKLLQNWRLEKTTIQKKQ